MRQYKRIRLDPDQYTMLCDQSKYEVEIPFAEDLDLWVDWKADTELTVWLYFMDGKAMPFASGLNGHFNLQTSRLLSVVLKSSKKMTVAVCVSYKDLSVMEKLDYTPVSIVPPMHAQIDLSSLLTDAVKRELEERGIVAQEVEVDDEDNLEDDPEADEFGEGYMETEEEIPGRPRPRASEEGAVAAAAVSPDAGTVSPGGSSSEPDVDIEPKKATRV